MQLSDEVLSVVCSSALYWCNRGNRFVNRIYEKHLLAWDLSTWLEEVHRRELVHVYESSIYAPRRTVIYRWNADERITVKKRIAPVSITYVVDFDYDNGHAYRWTLQEENDGRGWSVNADSLYLLAP